MDNPKVIVKRSRWGKGVFAAQKITKGETIASFDGKVYGWYSKFWNDDLKDHCIQFEERKWRDSKGIARLINHSCAPNAGIKNLFDIVAMRTILPIEEITWDYEMTEDHPWWRLECKCGSENCRKLIGAYKNMPSKTRRQYQGYISEWLIKKYE